MIVGIDASNLRVGGGVRHLVELLRHAEPRDHGIDRVVVWSGRRTLEQLPEKPWLDPVPNPLLDGGLIRRVLWQHALASHLRQKRCDVLFSPGGSYLCSFRPFVTMSRNMLPFEYPEMRRYGFSPMFFKLLLLRGVQAATFRNADGLIFVSEYARSVVEKVLRGGVKNAVTIPHGVDRRFYCEPKQQKAVSSCTLADPFRLLYVSDVTVYKHQWHVVAAVADLRKDGIPGTLELIGLGYPAALRRLRGVLDELDPEGAFARYIGPVPHEELPSRYHRADLFVYASSCENLPNILLEAMASGLPIACSNRGPMPEVLGDAGIYFDPERAEDITRVLRMLIEDTGLRDRYAKSARERARLYTWERCARETFDFLVAVARGSSLQREVPKG
jgi:glycosyltransferase involved in cell wall biosynthesis